MLPGGCLAGHPTAFSNCILAAHEADCSHADVLPWLPSSTQSKRRFRITGHLPNTVYRFAVSAANSAGVGPESVQRIVFYECKNGFKDNGTGCKVG